MPHSHNTARVLVKRIIECLLVGLSTFAGPDMARQAMGNRGGASNLRQQLINDGAGQRGDWLHHAAKRGCICVPRAMPSKPITESCRGTFQPCRRSSAIRLIASKSLEQTNALGACGPDKKGSRAAKSAWVWAGISITGKLSRPCSRIASP